MESMRRCRERGQYNACTLTQQQVSSHHPPVTDMVIQKPFHNSDENKIQTSLMDAWTAAVASAGNTAVGGENAPTDDDDDNVENTVTDTADGKS